jgi:hypothetical protein
MEEDGNMVLDNEQAGVWRQLFVVSLKVPSRYFTGDSEESHESSLRTPRNRLEIHATYLPSTNIGR